MNSVVLIGNLTKDIEIVETTNSKCAKLVLAVRKEFAVNEGQSNCEFINVTCWGNLAEHCSKYLGKGSKVGVVGRIENHTYEKDGIKRVATQVVASSVEFLNTKTSSTAPKEENEEKQPKMTEVDDNGLPF